MPMTIAPSAWTCFQKKDSRVKSLDPVGTPPDERAFRSHVQSAKFQEGVSRGRWRVIGDVLWPIAMIAVSAAARVGAPSEFILRFDLSGYPDSAPTATPWNPNTASTLEPDLRPKGENVGSVFRSDWNEGCALYAPFDRVALSSHSNWTSQHPRRTWNPSKDLAWLLQILHEMLNNDDYTGT